ncbi:Hsp70 family protein [Pseudomonadota bacterium]
MSPICGIDFGTSNSTIGIADGEYPQLLRLENDEQTLPSALFFNFEENSVSYGRAAIDDYIDGEFGRFMRSLKSVLGTSLMNQQTHIKQRQVRYSDIIGEFIAEMKSRAEQQLNAPLENVVMGRPVHFVDGDKNADDTAQNTLADICRDIGFKDVEFQFEPIAAALDYEQNLTSEELSLIVDIGGGTSDFTIIRLGPENSKKRDRHPDILATTGVHVGGNDFDRRFNLAKAMPALGMRSYMKGPKRLELPSSPYFDLATWHLIHNQYQRTNITDMEALRLHAEQPHLIERLVKLLKNQDGHRLIGQIEACKIELASATETKLSLDFIERELSLDCHRKEFDEATAGEVDAISETIRQSLITAQIKSQQISSVFLTGGTTGLPSVREAVNDAFPNCKLVDGDRFGSVGMGLTLDAMRRFA